MSNRMTQLSFKITIYLAYIARLISAVPPGPRNVLPTPKHASMTAQPFDEASLISQGWALLATSKVAGTKSCGHEAFCPESLHCSAGIGGGFACCFSNSIDCGATQQLTRCANSSWSLWEGHDGSMFCCNAGMSGERSEQRNPSCVVAESLPSQAVRSPNSDALSLTSPLKLDQAVPQMMLSERDITSKPVFFHYMLAGATEPHLELDIVAAQKMGADAFAINSGNFEADWAGPVLQQLFFYADKHGFKLFFSFDMAAGYTSPDQFTSFLTKHIIDPAYYQYNNLPVVSTFNGGLMNFGQSSVNAGWQAELKDVMANAGHPIYFIPAFDDISMPPSDFFTQFSACDGAMNWNSWAPTGATGDALPPINADTTYLNSAKAVTPNKQFMMGVSPLQFKHIDSNQNWYRRAEENLPTWNDCGEGHNMGYIWEEALVTSPAIQSYAANHSAYDQILPAFIQAYKSGASDTSTMYPMNGMKAQGIFYHHFLLANSKCNDPLGVPAGLDSVQDKVTTVVLVAPNVNTLSISISSGGNRLGSMALRPGLNTYTTNTLTLGTVVATVTDSASQFSLSGTGPVDVTDSGDIYNYNIQVVALTV